MEQLAPLLSGAVGGAVIAGLFSIYQEWSRRKHERWLWSSEREEKHRRALQDRREAAYRTAVARLRAAQAAFGRAADVQYGEERDLHHPFSPGQSFDKAIEEAEALRSVQADVDLFGSSEVAAELASALDEADRLRWAFGMPDDWTANEVYTTTEAFKERSSTVLALMRRDLES